VFTSISGEAALQPPDRLVFCVVAGAPSRLPLADDFIWPDRKRLLWSELWRVYVGTNEGCPQLPSRFNDSSPKTNWDAFWDYFIDDRTESERDRDRGRLKIWLIKKETG